MRWTIRLDTGPQRVNHAAVGIPSKKLVFSFGGYWTGPNYNDIEKIDTHIFNAVFFKWHKLPTPDPGDEDYSSIPYMRYGHTVCLVDQTAYLFGGRNDRHGASSVLHCFDTESLKWSIPAVTGKPPGARDGHSSCAVGTRMYIFGGYQEVEDCFSAAIYFLDTRDMTWHHPRPSGARPTWRDFHTSTTVGTKIFVFGGRGDHMGPYHSSNEIYDNKIYEYDTVSNVWSDVEVSEPQPIGRRSHSAIAFDQKIYIFGGYNGNVLKHFNDLWSFDTESKKWMKVQTIGQGPCPRRRQILCLLGTEAVLYGGTCPEPDNEEQTYVDNESALKDLSDIYILDLSPSLKTLCMLVLMQHKLDLEELPLLLRQELERMPTCPQPNRSFPGLTQG